MNILFPLHHANGSHQALHSNSNAMNKQLFFYFLHLLLFHFHCCCYGWCSLNSGVEAEISLQKQKQRELITTNQQLIHVASSKWMNTKTTTKTKTHKKEAKTKKNCRTASILWQGSHFYALKYHKVCISVSVCSSILMTTTPTTCYSSCFSFLLSLAYATRTIFQFWMNFRSMNF